MGERDIEATDARDRILRVAREEIARNGWAAATSGRVAVLAGVSKALIHYHFRDKPALIVAVATQCRENIAARGAIAEGVSRGGSPLDEFIDWLETELRSDDLRVAVILGSSASAAARRAAGGVLALFRRELLQRVAWVFAALGLTARIDLELIADVFAVAAQGMSVMAGASDARRRQVIETLWLGTLLLGD